MFIFESIGTQELLLIGIVALIFLGPRRMPEIARKLGKMMSDFRNTTNEFKATWEREVNFENEARQLKDLTNFDEEITIKPVARENLIGASVTTAPVELPEVKAADAAQFEKFTAASTDPQTTETAIDPDAKENWL